MNTYRAVQARESRETTPRTPEVVTARADERARPARAAVEDAADLDLSDGLYDNVACTD